jgi:serine/threonine-protein kinase
LALQPGARLGSYEILSPLGAGGMGEVYRARDTRLKRDVAIKVLPDTLSTDPDRLARFQREAELLATLNHPNIAAIYGLEDAGGASAIVMELVEGETLGDVLAKGSGLRAQGSGSEQLSALSPQPSRGLVVDEALAIARQIADALEAAHDRGVIHRDLKPANIKITPDGRVKVLDFGLAKLGPGGAGGSGRPGGSGGPGGESLSLSPTLSIHATNAGVILGTAAYMSPEQARAKPVDRRTDIWAFGCVLFEMLTGRQAFAGETVTDVLSAITRDEPDWNALPAATPPHIRTLLRRCLQKDPQKRLPHIGIARIEIDEGPSVNVAQGFSPAGGFSPAPSSAPVPKSRAVLPWIVAAVLGGGLIAVVARWAPWRVAPPRDTIRIEGSIGADASLAADQGPAVVPSPDGTLLAFVAQKGYGAAQVFVRRVDHLDAAALSGTENARNPFFSPDGQWIGFFADGKLKKISVSGGAAITLCDSPIGRGASWGGDGTIVFQPSNTGTGSNLGMVLLAVPAVGGQPHAVTTRQEGEANERWPQVLPGNRAVLYTAPQSAGAYADANVSVQTMSTHERKILVRGGYFGRYVPSGHLLYLHDATMFAAPFDVDRLELTGPPVPVIERVTVNTTIGSGQFAVADNGTLAYLTGLDTAPTLPITWLSRDGRTSLLRPAPSNWSNISLSPDGHRLAMDIAGQQNDIWVYDWTRDALERRTFDVGTHQLPTWTPDGRRITFRATAGTGSFNIYWVRADGAGVPERLTTSPNTQFPGSWHPSGKFLAFTETSPRTNNDVMILPLEGDETSGWKPGTPTAFANSQFTESEPAFSSDGHWIAYTSAETGRGEIFVRPFPGPGGKYQVSTDGGAIPMWSRTRHELFYFAPDQRIHVVSYTVKGDSFAADKPRAWAEARLAIRPRGIAGNTGRNFDPHPDGERFAVALAPPESDVKQDKVILIFNFFDELKRLAPAGRK